MKKFTLDEIELIIANAEKQNAYENQNYPLSLMDDRLFEVLNKYYIDDQISSQDKEFARFESAVLMTGVGEKGVDIQLITNNNVAAICQCKRLKSRLDLNSLATEIIKFAIHQSEMPNIFAQPADFTYFISAASGVAQKVQELKHGHQILKIIDDETFARITTQILKKYVAFKSLQATTIIPAIKSSIAKFRIKIISPESLNRWLASSPEVVELFFKLRTIAERDESTKLKEPHLPIQDLTRFLTSYRRNALEKLNLVNFIGFDLQKHRQKPSEITLTDLFVNPKFNHFQAERKMLDHLPQNKKPLKIADILNHESNIVILGDPGAGKSLLVKFLIVNFLSKHLDHLGLRTLSDHIPFRIELRKYNEYRENNSISEYLSNLLAREFQVETPIDFVNKLLKTQKTIIFFDGLDEIFDESQKNETKNQIELFCLSNPETKAVVTSRFIGYHDTKFTSKFKEYSIRRLDPQQIEELIHRFFSSQIIVEKKRQLSIENCSRQIRDSVDDNLKTNPLILTLILILASNNIAIPDSKLEIYESCTQTLVETIDQKAKELKFDTLVRNKRSTFANLAYWQYQQIATKKLVTYEKAIDAIGQHLLSTKELQDPAIAFERAKKFLDYAEKRSIYFENNFTHKTFLEYYASDYLYLNYVAKPSQNGKSTIIKILEGNLRNPFWYIVFELLLLRIDQVQPDTEFLDEILSSVCKIKSSNVYVFLLTNLPSFINVSDITKVKALGFSIEEAIRAYINAVKTKGSEPYLLTDNDIVSKLRKFARNKSGEMLLDEVFNDLQSKFVEFDERIALYILIVEYNNSRDHRATTDHKIKINEHDSLEKAKEQSGMLLQAIHGIFPTNHSLETWISFLKSSISNFGIESLFKYSLSPFQGHRSYIPPFFAMLFESVRTSSPTLLDKALELILAAGKNIAELRKEISSSPYKFFVQEEYLDKIIALFSKSDSAIVDEFARKILEDDKYSIKKVRQFRKNGDSDKLRKLEKYLVRFQNQANSERK